MRDEVLLDSKGNAIRWGDFVRCDKSNLGGFGNEGRVWGFVKDPYCDFQTEVCFGPAAEFRNTPENLTIIEKYRGVSPK